MCSNSVGTNFVSLYSAADKATLLPTSIADN